MKKPTSILLAWLVFGIAAEVRADWLFATHYSVWGQSEITELDPQTGSVLNAYAPPTTPNQNAGLAFDGTTVYFLSDNDPLYNTIYKLNPASGAVLGHYTLPNNSTRTGLTALGTTLYDLDWNPNHNVIEMFDLATGASKGSIDFKAANPTAGSLMLDGDLGTIHGPDALLAVAHPVGSPTPTEVLELDPASGVIEHQFTIQNADAQHSAKGVDSIGQEIYLSLHVALNGNQIIVYNTSGVEKRRFSISGSSGVQALATGASPTPEPSTLGLLLAPALTMLLYVWRRQKQGY